MSILQWVAIGIIVVGIVLLTIQLLTPARNDQAGGRGAGFEIKGPTGFLVMLVGVGLLVASRYIPAGGVSAPSPGPTVIPSSNPSAPQKTPAPANSAPATLRPAITSMKTDGPTGSRDLDHFCLSKGFSGAYLANSRGGAFNNWTCQGDDSPIDFMAACAYSYPGRKIAKAAPDDPNDPDSWKCYLAGP